MSAPIRIAVDAMGGDYGPSITIPACVSLISKHPRLDICLFGDAKLINPLIPAENSKCFSVVHCAETIAMSDKPSVALRGKKDSSLRRAIDAVASGEFDAVVSAGNTGAMMAIGRLVLRTIPSIDRPAICTAIPTAKGSCYMLDMGANVDCRAEHLLQFALLGSALASAVEGKQFPSVKLLNIGEEEVKGTESIKLAATMLAQQPLNYQGYIEADGIFTGNTDVVVCDGFIGNVALKASEGVAHFVADLARKEFANNLWARLVSWILAPIFKTVLKRIQPENYNGAFFLGLQGVLVKSHGSANALGFEKAMAKTIAVVEQNLLGMIDAQLDELMTE